MEEVRSGSRQRTAMIATITSIRRESLEKIKAKIVRMADRTEKMLAALNNHYRDRQQQMQSSCGACCSAKKSKKLDQIQKQRRNARRKAKEQPDLPLST